MTRWGASRLYRSGTSWCLWRWTDVDSEYITRLHLVKTPLFAICLHWIHKPDPEPFLHDHPVSFLSIILRGTYIDRQGDGKAHAHRWFNFIPANKKHSIMGVSPSGALTLAFMGPKVQEWGFYDAEEKKTFWKDYYARARWSTHRWSGWPGAICLDCGIPDPLEQALADGWDLEENPLPKHYYCPVCPAHAER